MRRAGSRPGNRWYTPWLARWMSCDPLPPTRPSQACNQYAYVRGNPLSFVDPGGLQEDLPDDLVAGEPGRNGPVPQEEPPPAPPLPPGLTADQKKAFLDRWRSLGVQRAWATAIPSPASRVPPRSMTTHDEKIIFMIGDITATYSSSWSPCRRSGSGWPFGTRRRHRHPWVRRWRPARSCIRQSGTSSATHHRLRARPDPRRSPGRRRLAPRQLRTRGRGQSDDRNGAPEGRQFHELAGTDKGTTWINMDILKENIAAGGIASLSTVERVLRARDGSLRPGGSSVARRTARLSPATSARSRPRR